MLCITSDSSFLFVAPVQLLFPLLNSNLNLVSGTIATDYSNNPITYYYNCFIAMIFINGLKNVAKNEFIKICTLPECARPSGNRIVDITNSSGDVVRLTIQSSGNVTVYNYTDINPGNITQSFTYIK